MAVYYIAARDITLAGQFYHAGDAINATGWTPEGISTMIRLGWIEPTTDSGSDVARSVAISLVVA